MNTTLTKMTFLVAPDCPDWRRICHRWDTPTPLSNALCMQIVACEVDGPLVQPSTWHLYTLLTPPSEGKGLHMGRDSLLRSLWWHWRRDFQCLLFFLCHKTRDFRCHLLRLLRWWLGNGHGWGRMVFFRWGWGRETGGVGYSSPQKPVKTLCLWSTYCRCNLLQSLCLQLLRLFSEYTCSPQQI